MKEEKQEDRTVLETVDRRQFTLASAMAILSGVAITITSALRGKLLFAHVAQHPPPPRPRARRRRRQGGVDLEQPRARRPSSRARS